MTEDMRLSDQAFEEIMDAIRERIGGFAKRLNMDEGERAMLEGLSANVSVPMLGIFGDGHDKSFVRGFVAAAYLVQNYRDSLDAYLKQPGLPAGFPDFMRRMCLEALLHSLGSVSVELYGKANPPVKEDA